MSGFGGLGIGLTVVFVFFFFALAAELFYVLWWRRRFRSENSASAAVSELSGDPYTSPSKELLYFLCWKNQSRVEPSAAPATSTPLSPDPPQYDGLDLMKLHGLYGPSRVLFTIKEEREDSEAEDGKLPREGKEEGGETLGECLSMATGDLETCVGDAAPLVTDVSEKGINEGTPFSTPCASPPFYTPLSSPLRGADESASGNLTYMPEGYYVSISID